MLASFDLASSVVQCDIHATEHESIHRAIATTFDVEIPDHVVEPRLLFKNAPWKAIRERIGREQQRKPMGRTVQEQTDRLMTMVSGAVVALTPNARPSLYAKRWWTRDLTQLRRVYTHWRNLARRQRRAGCARSDMKRARTTAKEYHDAVHRQQRAHWDEFLADEANIWKATKYLQPGDAVGAGKIPPSVRADGSQTRDKTEQAKELLSTFVPPLPEAIQEEGRRPQRSPVPMAGLTMRESKEACSHRSH